MLRILIQSARAAVAALISNKLRSVLTMLGIVVGVSAVVIIMSIGAGAQSLILSQIESLGTNLIGVIPGYSEDNQPPASIMGIMVTTLTYEDAMALRDKNNVPNIVELVAYLKGVGTITWRSNSYDTNLSGATAGYPYVEGGEVELGRFFTENEEKNLSRVIVLGSTAKRELFGDSDAIGERVKIRGHIFEVIGVMKERGMVALQDYDDQVFIPIKTMQKLIAGVNHIGLLRARVDYEENIEHAIDDVKMVLRERHDIRDSSGKSDDFTVRSAAQALDAITSVTNALKYFLAAMAAISLMVGGVGIMNIMLVIVTERTREIGLRKAVGANNRAIFSQFIIEPATMTLLSGTIGAIIGVIVSYLVAFGARFMGYAWSFIVPPSSILIAISVSMVVGLIFGIYPAWKASRLDPIEALRYE